MYLPGRNGNTELWASVHRSIIHNSQKLETARCPLTGIWINKSVCPYNEILFNNKKEPTTGSVPTLRISVAWSWMKEVRHKGYMHDGSIHMAFQKDKSVRTVFRRAAAWGQERQEEVVWEEGRDNFQQWWDLYVWITRMPTQLYTIVKTQTVHLKGYILSEVISQKKNLTSKKEK